MSVCEGAMATTSAIDFLDIRLACIVCGAGFIFSAGQQVQGVPEPRRCPACRGKHRQERRYQPAGLDDVLARARQEMARYRD